ncbi:unnamed protein product [Pleuronectes platessa]|uniref:Uncharacterized protein n=1 Tax=Pleuronectes platessa TaxID=8262 RepID=A0A9N7VBV3_PLEPL|nr:unnamed protein product [Pleuronectes platessa]
MAECSGFMSQSGELQECLSRLKAPSCDVTATEHWVPWEPGEVNAMNHIGALCCQSWAVGPRSRLAGRSYVSISTLNDEKAGTVGLYINTFAIHGRGRVYAADVVNILHRVRTEMKPKRETLSHRKTGVVADSCVTERRKLQEDINTKRPSAGHERQIGTGCFSLQPVVRGEVVGTHTLRIPSMH